MTTMTPEEALAAAQAKAATATLEQQLADVEYQISMLTFLATTFQEPLTLQQRDAIRTMAPTIKGDAARSIGALVTVYQNIETSLPGWLARLAAEKTALEAQISSPDGGQ